MIILISIKKWNVFLLFFKNNLFLLGHNDSKAASWGTFVYSSILSTDVISFSNSAAWRVPHWSEPVKLITWVITSPTSPLNVLTENTLWIFKNTLKHYIFIWFNSLNYFFLTYYYLWLRSYRQQCSCKPKRLYPMQNQVLHLKR